MNIYFFLKTEAMNILSEPLVNSVILWQNRDLQFIQKRKWDSQFIQNRAALVYISRFKILIFYLSHT